MNYKQEQEIYDRNLVEEFLKDHKNDMVIYIAGDYSVYEFGLLWVKNIWTLTEVTNQQAFSIYDEYCNKERYDLNDYKIDSLIAIKQLGYSMHYYIDNNKHQLLNGNLRMLE